MRASLLVLAAAHPSNLECGTDATTRLKAGATIMHAQVVEGDDVKVSVSGSDVTVTSKPGVFFAVRAFGDGATLTSGSGLVATANCANQLYTSDGSASEYKFTQSKATKLAVGYAAASAPSPVSLVEVDVPAPAEERESALLGPETVLDLTWTDCGDSSTHAKVSDLEPKTLTLGQSTPLVGTGKLDETVASGNWQITVKAGLISHSCNGDLATKTDCKLPLGLGTITWDGLTLPLQAGPAIKVSTTVDMSGKIPGSLAKATITVSATETNGHKLLCLQVKTAPESQELVV